MVKTLSYFSLEWFIVLIVGAIIFYIIWKLPDKKEDDNPLVLDCCPMPEDEIK